MNHEEIMKACEIISYAEKAQWLTDDEAVSHRLTSHGEMTLKDGDRVVQLDHDEMIALQKVLNRLFPEVAK